MTWAERKAAAFHLTHCQFCGKKCNGSGKVAHERACGKLHKEIPELKVVRVEIDWQARKKVS